MQLNNFDFTVDDESIVQTDFVTKCYDKYLAGDKIKKSFRSYNHYHPSEIGGCIRKAVAMMLGTPGDFYTHGRAQRTFANGHKTHDRLQEDLGDMGILLGYWKCLNCEQVMGRDEKHGIKKPAQCSFCHSAKMSKPVTNDYGEVICEPYPIFQYKEISVTHPTLNISGHCDGIVEIGNLKFIIDFKTIETNQFDNILDSGVPHKKYIAQINQYMDILGVPLGLIFYENSNNKKTAEFFVKYDKKIVDAIYQKVIYAEQYREIGQLPPIPESYILNPVNHECGGFPGYPPCAFYRQCFPNEFNSTHIQNKIKDMYTYK